MGRRASIDPINSQQIERLLESFLPIAQRLVDKIRTYIPVKEDRFHQAQLPGFPRRRAEKEVLSEVVKLSNLLQNWDDGCDEDGRDWPEGVAIGITWFGNVVRILMRRWGWGAGSGKEIGPFTHDDTTIARAAPPKCRTVRKSELEAMESALDMIRPKSEIPHPSAPCFPSFNDRAQLSEGPFEKPTVLPLPAAAPRSAPPPRDDQLCPCQHDCLDIVRQADWRLTNQQISNKLIEAGIVHGKSTIKMALAFLVRTGLLTNRKDTKPRGYGLPEWDSAC